ncbi:ROK family protein [Natronospora cellulosivora (SeqCode)]
MMKAIGIDIGGTKTNIGIVDEKGKVLEKKTFATNAQNPSKLKDDLINEIYNIIKKDNDMQGIGIASAGRVDFSSNKVVYATDNLKGWTNIPITEILKKEFKLPVYIDNDVNAALLCDIVLNPNLAEQTVIFLTIGTGLGGAIAINGNIIRGKTGSSGEFGHMVLYPGGHKCNCGKEGCAEQYISGTAYKKILKKKLIKNGLEVVTETSPTTIQEKIFKSNPIYMEALKEISSNLAILLESIKNCIDYDTCIIGGSFTVYQELILKFIEERFSDYNHKYSKDPEFIFSRQGNSAGMIGGGLQVFESL